MKNLLLSAIALFSSVLLYSQGVGINPNGAQPDPSAMLDVTSNSAGILIPRMTQSERDAIQNPATGLQIYNTDTDCFNVYVGTNWRQSCYECDFPLPVLGNNGPVCEGSTLTLTSTLVSGATYSWSGPNGFSSSDQNPSIPNVTVAAAGVYFLTVSLNGCSISAGNITASINASPVITAGSNSPYCDGGTLILSSTSISGATYSWTGPNGYSSAAQNPTISNASGINAGTYSVMATANGCTGPSSSVTVSLANPVPSSPGAITGSGGGPSGQTETYTISAVNFATNYTWTVPSGSTINSGQGTTSISVSFGNTSGQICVTASNGCGTSPATCLNVVICGSPSWIVNSQSFTQDNDTYRSSSLGGYPATNSVDGVVGNGAGRWVSGMSLGMPQWVAFDLMTTHYVTNFRIWNLNDDHPNQGIKDFKLQVAGSISGPWTDVLTGQAVNQSSSWQEFTLPNAAASRYWRLYATSGWDTSYGWVQLLEVGWKGCN